MNLFEQWLQGNDPPIAKLIGLRIVSAGEGKCVIQLDACTDRHANPMGTLHGGVLCDLADAAMGTAWASQVSEGETFTTVELKINFFRPVWNDTLTATATVIRKGLTLGYVECDVHDSQNRLVAKSSSTCMTLRGKPATGR